MITSSIRSLSSTLSSFFSEPSERRPFAGSSFGERKPTTSIGECVRVGERVGDIADVLARAHQHRAPSVAGGAQQRPGQPLV